MTPMEKVVANLKLAALSGLYSGLIKSPTDAAYIRRCTEFDVHTGSNLLFTRDIGHHTSGWWKNPDYERCRHLSISFREPQTEWPLPFDRDRGRRWARMFFGDDTRWVWVEPPYSDIGKQLGVHHYRLFCDQGWQPLKPRGEVYSKQFTEIGWKSFSEIHGPRVASQYEGPLGTPVEGA